MDRKNNKNRNKKNNSTDISSNKLMRLHIRRHGHDNERKKKSREKLTLF